MDGFEQKITVTPKGKFDQNVKYYGQNLQKEVVYFFYTKRQEIPMSFKALSTHELFKATQFLSIKNPDIDRFTDVHSQMLPTVGSVKKISSSQKSKISIEQPIIDA